MSATPYTDIKNAIVERFCDSKNTRIHRLLQNIELGDTKPSQLYRKLKVHGGSDVTEDFLKTIWLKRLPIRSQEVLASVSDTLSTDKLAELADRIQETTAQNHILTVEKRDTKPDTESSISAQLCEIFKRLNQLDRSLNNNQPRSSSRNRTRSPYPSNSRSKSDSVQPSDQQPPNGPKPCYFHKRFHEAARSCKPGCLHWESFKSKN